MKPCMQVGIEVENVYTKFQNSNLTSSTWKRHRRHRIHGLDRHTHTHTHTHTDYAVSESRPNYSPHGREAVVDKNAEGTNATTNIRSSTPRVSPQSAWSKFASKSSLSCVESRLFSVFGSKKCSYMWNFLKSYFIQSSRNVFFFQRAGEKWIRAAWASSLSRLV